MNEKLGWKHSSQLNWNRNYDQRINHLFSIISNYLWIFTCICSSHSIPFNSFIHFSLSSWWQCRCTRLGARARVCARVRARASAHFTVSMREWLWSIISFVECDYLRSSCCCCCYFSFSFVALFSSHRLLLLLFFLF